MFADRIDEGPTPISTVIVKYDFSKGLFARGEKDIQVISYDSQKCRFQACKFLGGLVADCFTFTESGVQFNKEYLRKLIDALDASDSMVHRSLRILYLLVASDFDDLLDIGLHKFGYKYWHYPAELDSLELALKRNKLSMLNTFAHFLEHEDAMNLTESTLLGGLQSESLTFKLLVVNKLMSTGATTFQLDTTLPADHEPFTKCFKSDKFVKSEDFRKFLDDYKYK